jgi:hypothetical protein
MEDETSGFYALLSIRARCGESALSLAYKTGNNGQAWRAGKVQLRSNCTLRTLVTPLSSQGRLSNVSLVVISRESSCARLRALAASWGDPGSNIGRLIDRLT